MKHAVARYLAVTLLVIGASHLLRPRGWAKAFRRLHSCGRAGAFVNGGLSLASGAVVGAGHSSWAWPGTALTGFGWAMVAKNAICQSRLTKPSDQWNGAAGRHEVLSLAASSFWLLPVGRVIAC